MEDINREEEEEKEEEEEVVVVVVKEEKVEEGLVEGKKGLARIGTLSAVMEINKHTPHNVSNHKKGYCVFGCICLYVIVQIHVSGCTMPTLSIHMSTNQLSVDP